jgi:hypothetical protein
MNDNSEFKIAQNISPPSQLDSFERKAVKPWWKAVGDTIYSEWFYNGVSGKM